MCVDYNLLEKKSGRTAVSPDHLSFRFIGKVFEEKCFERKGEENNVTQTKEENPESTTTGNRTFELIVSDGLLCTYANILSINTV